MIKQSLIKIFTGKMGVKPSKKIYYPSALSQKSIAHTYITKLKYAYSNTK